MSEASYTTALPCQVHGRHSPTSHINHVHHIWPQADGGPNVADNKVVVCPTGHYNIHTILDAWRKGNSVDMRRYSQGERAYAYLGWMRMQRGAM